MAKPYSEQERRDIIIVTALTLFLPFFSIYLRFVERLYDFSKDYDVIGVTEYLINFCFLYLSGLLYVTYRRWLKAEKKRKELENIIASINPDVLIVVDRQRKIIVCNNTIKRMFGYDVDETVQQTTDILYFDRRSYPEDKKREIYEILEKEGFHIGLATGKKKSGATFPLEIITGNLGGAQGAVLLLRDITARKEAEDALLRARNELEMRVRERTEELTVQSMTLSKEIIERKRKEEEKRILQERLQQAEKMEALGQLAGGVAHDLNNVLGVLSGYSELLMKHLPEDNLLRRYAANILKSSEKGAAIIQDLLTLARRGVVVTEVTNLNRIVSNFLATPEFDTLKNHHCNVAIKTDLENDLPHIKGSPVHLEKTLMNLVLNAAESIVCSGEVEIRTENRYLDKPVRSYDRVEEGDYTVLTVSDNGRGIPVADLEKIFEPFYSKKKIGRSGTGLGLAIVWGTVKDHDGYIDVQSVEGKGSTFTLYFPVTTEEIGKESQKAPVEQYAGHGESILVVDDMEEQRQVATDLLVQLGYQVNSVASGEEAVEYLKSHKADILVLDMVMEPGIDGLETYKQVLEDNPHQKTIIVSGYSETDRVKETERLGAGPYVKKPYLREKIGVAIRDELARNRMASSIRRSTSNPVSMSKKAGGI